MVESEEAVAEALLKAVGADDHEPEVVGMVLDALHRAARLGVLYLKGLGVCGGSTPS